MGDRILHGVKPGAPYAAAVSWDRLLFVSGAVALDEHGGIPTGIAAQTRQVLTNLSRVVGDAGGDIASTLKATVYLTDVADFPGLNSAYVSFFPSGPPARTTVGVAALSRPEFVVEIDIIVGLNG